MDKLKVFVFDNPNEIEIQRQYDSWTDSVHPTIIKIEQTFGVTQKYNNKYLYITVVYRINGTAGLNIN